MAAQVELSTISHQPLIAGRMMESDQYSRVRVVRLNKNNDRVTMERIKNALEKARLERERLQQKSLLRRVDNMEKSKLAEVDALRTQLLTRAPFSHCTQEQQQGLLRDGTFVQLREGETLQFAGEIDGYVHFLLTGTVVAESDSEPRAELKADVLAEIIALDKAGLKTQTIIGHTNADIFRIAQSCLPSFAKYSDGEPLPQDLYTDTQSGKDLADLVDRLKSEQQSIEQAREGATPKIPLGENTLGFNFDVSELAQHTSTLSEMKAAAAENTEPPPEENAVTYEPDVPDEIGEFARQLDGKFRQYVKKVREQERARYDKMIENYAQKLKRAAEGKLREKVKLIRDRYHIAYGRKEEKLVDRVHKLREFANQITRQKAAIYEARRGLADKLAQAEKLHNQLNDLGDEVYTQLDRLDELMPSSDDVKDAVADD